MKNAKRKLCLLLALTLCVSQLCGIVRADEDEYFYEYEEYDEIEDFEVSDDEEYGYEDYDYEDYDYEDDGEEYEYDDYEDFENYSPEEETGRPSSIVSSFPDVPDDAPYLEAVNTLKENDIFTGDGNGYFNPYNTITRAETAAIMCRLMGLTDPGAKPALAPFDDVAASHWAAGYVSNASKHGVINGYGDGNFGPADPVTYEQAIKMLVCVWGYEPQAMNYGGWPGGYLHMADMLGITDGISYERSAPAPRYAVAQLVYAGWLLSANGEL